MPIRINLLAEQQAAEEIRRRDPVKRSIWVAGFIVALVLLWGASLRFQVKFAQNEMRNYGDGWKAKEKEYSQVTNQVFLTEQIKKRLEALHQLATNRFLWASPLNALQQALVPVPKVQVTRIRSDQTYLLTEAERPAAGKTGKPPTSTERIVMTIEARDFGTATETNYARFKDAIANFLFFKENLITNGVSLVNLSAPQPDPADASKSFMFLTLECRFREKVR